MEPVVTPRFVPTCSDELLAKLGDLAEKESTRIQSHLAESFGEAKWVRDERQIEDIQVFKKVTESSSRQTMLICSDLSTIF